VTTTQLRRYQIDPEVFDEWVEWWRTVLVPARAEFGFEVGAGYTVPGTHDFVWLVSAPVERDAFERLDEDWENSAVRLKALETIPRKVLSARLEIVEPVEL
jgi:hypothetical protein